MFTLLLGPDDFSKKEYLLAESLALKAEVEFFVSADDLPDAGRLLEQNLFTKSKFFVLEDAADGALNEALLPKLVASANRIFLAKEKLDKRTAWGKALSGSKEIVKKDFPLPHGKELDNWIIARAKSLGGAVTPQAADELSRRLGRDNAAELKFGGKVVEVTEVYSLWQAESELKKLLAYAEHQPVTPEQVRAIVSENTDIDIFDILNALGDGNLKRAFALLADFFGTEASSEEKTKTIQLNALLADQFRNILMLQDFARRQAPEAEILEKTGWKSGRLFVLKKIAGRFKPQKVADTLQKLEALDEALKTTQTPPRVILDMILTQLA